MMEADAKSDGAQHSSTVDVAAAGPRHRRRSKRAESTIAIIDRLLASSVPITINHRTKRVTAAEAIVLQLLQKAMAGNARAWRALVRYRDFAARHSETALEITYLDSGYTRAFANSLSESENG